MKAKEEPKQEIDMSKYISGIDPYDTQETLKEAAERYAHNYFNMHETNNYKALKQGYEAGAKEMAERMYSEKEVLKLLITFSDDRTFLKKDIAIKWFKQFKKK
jgi:hypothetical protein